MSMLQSPSPLRAGSRSSLDDAIPARRHGREAGRHCAWRVPPSRSVSVRSCGSSGVLRRPPPPPGVNSRRRTADAGISSAGALLADLREGRREADARPPARAPDAVGCETGRDRDDPRPPPGTVPSPPRRARGRGAPAADGCGAQTSSTTAGARLRAGGHRAASPCMRSAGRPPRTSPAPIVVAVQLREPVRRARVSADGLRRELLRSA